VTPRNLGDFLKNCHENARCLSFPPRGREREEERVTECNLEAAMQRKWSYPRICQARQMYSIRSAAATLGSNSLQQRDKGCASAPFRDITVVGADIFRELGASSPAPLRFPLPPTNESARKLRTQRRIVKQLCSRSAVIRFRPSELEFDDSSAIPKGFRYSPYFPATASASPRRKDEERRRQAARRWIPF